MRSGIDNYREPSKQTKKTIRMKKKIVDLIDEQLNISLESFEATSEEYRASADLDEEDTRDLDDFSQQAEDADMQMRIQAQAAKVQEKIAWLDANAMIARETVEPGALVETKNKWFFFGIALPTNIEADGKTVVGISEGAPIYPYLAGKKKGDTLEIGEEKLEILNVY